MNVDSVPVFVIVGTNDFVTGAKIVLVTHDEREAVETFREIRRREAGAAKVHFLEKWVEREKVEYDERAYTPPPDNCEVCKGEKGGTPGNENVIPVGGVRVVMCDYCHAAHGRKSDGERSAMYRRGERDGEAGLNPDSTHVGYSEGYWDGRRKRAEWEMLNG